MNTTLLTAQLAVAVWMASLNWTVELLVYPAFADIDRERWAAHHGRHVTRITPLVAPMMITQLVLAPWVLVDTPAGIPMWLAALNVVLVAATWAITALVSRRHHPQLSAAYSEAAWAGLRRWHSARTACWTILVVCAVAMLAHAS